MAGVGVIATLTVAEGKNADFEAIFSELAAAVSANEAGCMFYTLTRCRDNGQVYRVLECYADQAALDAHGQTDYFKAAGAKLGPCLAAAPQIEYLDAV
jgi:quinol monooxygenase YgiN